MIVVSALLGGLGLVCITYRGTFLGLLVGTQLLALGATSCLVLAGVAAGVPAGGHLFGLFAVLIAVAQLAAGYAFAVRLFYLRRQATMDELKSLKH